MIFALSLFVSLAVSPDTSRAIDAPVLVSSEGTSMVVAETDTVRRRPRAKAVELSDWYARRLALHRALTYSVVPLFVFQSIAGNQVWQAAGSAPTWAKTGHRAGATALAGVFGVNTVTGVWNLWEARSIEEGRTRRYAHTLLMLASDAGFTYAGSRLAKQAETSLDKRREHRKVAYVSMGLSLAGIASMLVGR
jgi:hypothetical protein